MTNNLTISIKGPPYHIITHYYHEKGIDTNIIGQIVRNISTLSYIKIIIAYFKINYGNIIRLIKVPVFENFIPIIKRKV